MIKRYSTTQGVETLLKSVKAFQKEVGCREPVEALAEACDLLDELCKVLQRIRCGARNQTQICRAASG